jgi:8-oxo-dGTP pyrophosphatase MutT (NUDIX family)
MASRELVQRASTRIVVFDAAGRLLLLHTFNLDEPPLCWWELPGGGIESGETPREAAVRELREETGLDIPALGPFLDTTHGAFDFAGRHFQQSEAVFGVSLTALAPSVRLPADDAFLGYSWWNLDGLPADLRLYPEELQDLARRFANLSS